MVIGYNKLYSYQLSSVIRFLSGFVFMIFLSNKPAPLRKILHCYSSNSSIIIIIKGLKYNCGGYKENLLLDYLLIEEAKRKE
jgi:hypothetical protein